ncbi:MAG: sodium-dependent transporter [Clostridiales bacterium]|nr:sodium-dependent transporter [Clostridiales bacterium]
MATQSRGFASRLGFILSMAAFSIGIGNLWKFPYMVGNNGGGAFLLVYIILVLLIGIPAFLIEVTLGRSAQLAPIKGMEKLEGKKTPFSSIGWLASLAIFTINSFAIMIVGGWAGGYIVKTFTGSMNGLSPDQVAATFGSYSGSMQSVLISMVEIVLLWLCLNGGIKKGVEKVCSILLPVLFVIMIGLTIYSNTLPGAVEGLKWYLTPDFSKIDMSVISAAATQVFFSLGIGMCCAYVYGSYFDQEGDLPASLATTAVLDTCIAILAGLLIVPALFSFGIEPTVGPSLIFVTLPNLFNQMGGLGQIFGGLFMICVYFAGFTSLLGGSEAIVANITEVSGCGRRIAATVICVAQFLFSIVFTLSFGDGAVAKFQALGLGFFDFADFIAEGVFLTVGAILMVVYIMFKWGFKKFQEEANRGAKTKIRIYDWMKPYFMVILPIILLFVCYSIVRMYI